MAVDSAPTIIRNVYESFRMLGQALLFVDGSPNKAHNIQIAALIGLNIMVDRPLRVLERLRALRHSINYQGYLPSEDEAHESLEIADALHGSLHSEIERIIENARNG